jgi:hypothetical protein
MKGMEHVLEDMNIHIELDIDLTDETFTYENTSESLIAISLSSSAPKGMGTIEFETTPNDHEDFPLIGANEYPIFTDRFSGKGHYSKPEY